MVLPGSSVHTDSHRLYGTLSSLVFKHFRVNHSVIFVCPDGIHANWIRVLFVLMLKLIRKYESGFTSKTKFGVVFGEVCFRFYFEKFKKQNAFLKLVYILKFTKESSIVICNKNFGCFFLCLYL